MKPSSTYRVLTSRTLVILGLFLLGTVLVVLTAIATPEIYMVNEERKVLPQQRGYPLTWLESIRACDAQPGVSCSLTLYSIEWTTLLFDLTVFVVVGYGIVYFHGRWGRWVASQGSHRWLWSAYVIITSRPLVILALLLTGIVLVVIGATATLPRDPVDDEGILDIMKHGLPVPWLTSIPGCAAPPESWCSGFLYRIDWTPFFVNLGFYVSVGYLLIYVYARLGTRWRFQEASSTGLSE